jgi:hypothetical protein
MLSINAATWMYGALVAVTAWIMVSLLFILLAGANALKRGNNTAADVRKYLNPGVVVLQSCCVLCAASIGLAVARHLNVSEFVLGGAFTIAVVGLLVSGYIKIAAQAL